MGGICGTYETDVKCRKDFRRIIESGKALGKFRRRWENITMDFMYFYCKSLCTLIVVYVLLFFVHVFLTLSMYSYCCLCILIVRPCILIVVYVYLLLSMYY